MHHLQQRPRKKLLQELNFAAALLQAGLPGKKLDHPSISIRGLIRKYITCIATPPPPPHSGTSDITWGGKR